MGPKAFYNKSYGVFVLGTKAGDKINACITNTCFQAAVSPARLAISCINNNLTCQMIKESKVFSLSVLDTTCSFETIKRFDYQSGRDVNKFEGISYSQDANDCPYITNEVCSVFECKVIRQQDLGSPPSAASASAGVGCYAVPLTLQPPRERRPRFARPSFTAVARYRGCFIAYCKLFLLRKLNKPNIIIRPFMKVKS